MVKSMNFKEERIGKITAIEQILKKYLPVKEGLQKDKKSSTIFCSQYCFEEWYDQLGGEASPLADAIIDRIAHDSYRINITSIDAAHDKSMREVYGLDKALRE